MNYKNNNNDLLQHVMGIFIGKTHFSNIKNKWKNIQGGTFITAYKDKPLTSENVWCCMSNGNYNKGNVFDNSIESANICRTRDSRRTSEQPKYFEISILVPKYRWRKIPIALANILLQRNRKRTIAIIGETNKMAIYLNSVWNERLQWSVFDLIDNLKEKAGISSNEQFTIYEIDCYNIISDESENHFENIGFFNNIDYNTILKILRNIYDFYKKYQNPSTKQLAYLIDCKTKKMEIKYNNDGANIRTLYDLITYHKVAKLFDQIENGEIEQIIPPEIPKTLPETLTYAYADLLLEFYGASKEKEICQLTKTANLSYHRDIEFEKPQQLLSLLGVIGELGSCDDIQHDIIIKTIDDFLNFYLIHLSQTKISSFGANWITQALSKAFIISNFQNTKIKNYINEKLIPILQDAFDKKESITQEATAAHALLSIPWNILFDNNIDNLNDLIWRWYHLQQQWKNGGFRYYENEAWYRTDVTSHVAEVLLAILSKDFTSFV